MSGYRVGAYARANLAEIYAFSKRTWGEAQATAYVSGMFNFFDRISRGDVPGRLVRVSTVVLRRAKQRRHEVYWETSSDFVLIRAVLHGRMLHAERLRDAIIDPS